MNRTAFLKPCCWLGLLSLFVSSLPAGAAVGSTVGERKDSASARRVATSIRYQTATVDGIRIFFRQAGDPRNPCILLLHGFSSSSHMFRDLIPLLASDFHVIAPDYPGFGHSDAPAGSQFEPTFARLTELMEKFVGAIGGKRFILYMQDFGGPVGFRMAVRHPESIDGLIVQNANAYLEGLPPAPHQPSGTQRQPMSAQVVNAEFIKHMYVNGTRNPAGLNPDAWALDTYVLSHPEAKRIQSSLIDDYVGNISLYPTWQAYMRERQPKTLVVWGRNDQGFSVKGAEAFRRDLRDIELRYFDTGHFALEEDVGPIAEAIIRRFSPAR